MSDKLFFYALCAAAFLSPFFLGSLDVYPQCAFLLVLSLIFLPLICARRIILPRIFPVFALYLLAVFLSALLAPEARWAARNACVLYLLYAAFFILPLFLNSRENIIGFLKCLVLSGFCVSLYGIGLYIVYGHPDYFIFSTFLNPNECAGYLILLLPAGLAVYLHEESVMTKYRFFILLTIISLCLILTGSRAAWASTGIAFVIFVAAKTKGAGSEPQTVGEVKNIFTLKFMLSTFGVLLVFLLLIKAPLLKKFLHAFSLSDRSLMFRLLVWKGSLRMIYARPLSGFGTGTFEWWYPHYKLGGALTKMAHNTYLQQAVETGLMGFFFFILFLSRQTFIMGKACLKAGGKDRLILAGILASSAAFLLHNTFDYTFYIPATGGLFFLLSGCFYALASTGDNNTTLTAERGRKTSIFTAAGAFVVFAALCFLCARSGIPDYYAQKAWDVEFEKNFGAAYSLYKKAASRDMNNGEVLMQCGVYARYYKNFAFSENVLRRTVKTAPSYAPFHNELAFTLLKNGKKNEAMKHFEISAMLNPTGTAPLRTLAYLYFQDAVRFLKNNNSGQAFLCFKNALRWYEKINKLSHSVYESDLYEPLAGRESNKDFSEAENMINIITSLLGQMKMKEKP